MIDIALIILSGLIVYIIGYPFVEWYSQTKDEMEDIQNDENQ